MRIVNLPLTSDVPIHINPMNISHCQPEVGKGNTLLWLKGDNMPTIIALPCTTVVERIANAIVDETSQQADIWNEQSSAIALDLIKEIRRLQWAFMGAALAFIILLLIIIGRG